MTSATGPSVPRRLLVALRPLPRRTASSTAGTWSTAVQTAEGTVTAMELTSVYMGRGAPPSLAPVVAMAPFGDGPVELFLASSCSRCRTPRTPRTC